MEDNKTAESCGNKECENTTCENNKTGSCSSTDATNLAGVKHIYYEVENDLLSKPNALSSIIHSNGKARAIVFCNSPSEADMVDVMLSKAGIKTEKLIGNVPQAKLAQACAQIEDHTLDALVVTDVAAGNIESKAFNLLVNYSIHSDPEIYIHRSTGFEGSPTGLRVASLISPLDFGNFHYLKKVVDFEIVKTELASPEEMNKIRNQQFLDNASKHTLELPKDLQGLVAEVATHADKTKIIEYLLYQTLVALPQATNNGDRNKNNRRNDRNDRNDRGDRNESRGRNRNDSRDGDRDNDRRDGDKREYEERPRRENTPPKKDVRLYIGHGSDEGLNEQALKDLFAKHTGDNTDPVKRVNIRSLYSFADIDESLANDLLEKLTTEDFQGKNFVCYKATTVSQAREGNKDENGFEGEDDQNQEHSQHENNDEQNGGDEEQAGV